jgi:hypothetical protein
MLGRQALLLLDPLQQPSSENLFESDSHPSHLLDEVSALIVTFMAAL